MSFLATLGLAVGSSLLGGIFGGSDDKQQQQQSVSIPRSSRSFRSGNRIPLQAQGGNDRGAQSANFDRIVGKWRGIISTINNSITTDKPSTKSISPNISVVKKKA